MKRTFEIEWDDNNGPMWMNRDNLLECLTRTCQNDRFTVRDVTGDADATPNSAGPRGHGPRPTVEELDAILNNPNQPDVVVLSDGSCRANTQASDLAIGIAARVWCDQDMKTIVIDGNAAEAIALIIDRVIESQKPGNL